eukprot:Plantae.Rhodophyta-Purpureofilum_apyrenoidigerum.ctg29573.p1 GENE.Plantae.Rhodophyta-Purpureofilum_apyrenoidigerum.ctg29573~~Plantae.Rhodophyta-Purpureofilum_apyrenoidigerum.ctg29573.p1  ORF type:complete len:265 (+),score=47.79 Plantae.Rhodophyta-Purpureofilum_apyrenoidigerum.ctg29573:69-863(+)
MLAFVQVSTAPLQRECWPTREATRRCCRRRLTPQARAPNRHSFREQLERGNLRLCLVGMSNCGKSFRSNQLANELGFEKLSVDEEIERVLVPELELLGYSGIEGLASWMGFPYNEKFKKNEGRYLEIEEGLTSAVDPPKGSNFVLDTTGSVIYMPPKVQQKLRDRFLVVHFNATDEMLSAMIENYFKSPKPVAWGDAYQRENNEDPDEALKRCYPNLLRARRERYHKLAHISIPAEVSLSPEIGCDDFIEAIAQVLSPGLKASF